jgi:hypothetical protein
MSQVFGMTRWRMFFRAAVLAAAVVLPAACTAAPGAGTADTSTAGSATRAGPAAAEEGSDRALPAHATFAHLVAAARGLDEAQAGEAAASCLLRSPRGDGSYRLEASVAVAVRPLPAPPTDLSGHLGAAAGSPFAALTPWGHLGPQDAPVAFATFTAFPPPAPGPVVVVGVTREGATVMGATGAPATQLTHASAAQLLGGAGRQASLWLLTAEADLPLERLERFLATLPAAGPPLVLAVPLPLGTQLPDLPTEGDGGEPVCTDGLAPLPPGEDEGDMNAARASAALGPLREAVSACAAALPHAAARPARIVIHLRVDPHGAVSEACAAEDTSASALLRGCVLRAARRLRFAPPNPPGWVDLALPVVVAPETPPVQRPLCSDAPPL